MDNSTDSMNRRKFIKVVGAGAALVALGSCSNPGTEENPSSSSSEDNSNGANPSSSSAASSSSGANPSSSSAAGSSSGANPSSSSTAGSSSGGNSSSSSRASSSSGGNSSSSSRASSSSGGNSSSSSRASSSSGANQSSSSRASSSSGGSSNKSKVYFTSAITPAGLMLAYNALNQQPSGKVAVKLSIGEQTSNYLRPTLIGGLVQQLNGTIVECNTLYGGPRDKTAGHKEIARSHGYYDIAEVDIMDENGSMDLTVQGGTRLQKNMVGKNFANYNYFVVLSHFKGHTLGGFGGALKNISIGIASRDGKEWIHTAAKTLGSWATGGVPFLESMAEAAKSVVDSLNGKILYINVMNKLSVDCDCFDSPAAPKMRDIGILSSLDPVALDQACVDLVYNTPISSGNDNKDLIERMESRKGITTVEHAAKIGLGSRDYEIVNL